MTKQKLYELFKGHFKEQLGLDLEEILVITTNDNGEDKFVLKMELLGISMASLKLKLSKEDHGKMAEFLTLIQDDNPLVVGVG